MGIIITGGVIKKDNKYLLVQESQEYCYGKWNLPAGHLDPNESIFDGAKREIKEECNLDVELTGIASITNRVMDNDEFLCIVFETKIIDGEVKIDQKEILDAKWYSYEEIKNMQDDLRSPDLIMYAIDAVPNNQVADINLIKLVEWKNNWK